jgi:thiosulfate/3-mercaptopyruvate sulfurtransferase
MHVTRPKRLILFSAFIAFSTFGFNRDCSAQFSGPVTSASAFSVPESQRIEPAALVKLLQAPSDDRPVMLQVGSHIMFAQSHIPGSVFAGPGSQSAGLHLLETKVASTPKSKLIVIYCGCCPWDRCPNIGPVYQRLYELGFTNVKALYLANNFGSDWVARGYPADKGE